MVKQIRTRTTGGKNKMKSVEKLLMPALRSKIPVSVSPMLCTLTREVLQDDRFLYEIKWDGYRILSYVDKGKVRMDSRSALDYTLKYPAIAEALKSLGHDVVMDGEVVVLNEEGRPDFDSLQLYNGHDTPISYSVFDILWLDGRNLMNLPLTDRKEILEALVSGHQILRFSASFSDGQKLYQQMLDGNMEGIVAKQKNSFYVPGQRGDSWLKTPTRKRQEFVIGGWAESDKNRSFKSLLFGAYRDGALEWIGRSGSGYKEKEMPAILQKLKSLETQNSPFTNKVLDTKGAKTHWVKPQLVANFEFATWTRSGRIRKPATFLGFRKDKKAKDVVREIPKAVIQVEKEINEGVKEKKSGKPKPHARSSSNWAKVDKLTISETQDFDIGDCIIQISDVEREVWKGISKADLITYYHSVSRLILPYLKDRPQSLHIHPVHAGAPGFFIKDMEDRQPQCGEIFSDKRRHPVQGRRNRIDYLICNNEATLLWMVNLGCIEINPWNSRAASPASPDYIAIDLDPTVPEGEEPDYVQLMHTALAAKQFCDDHRLKAFPKTSGKTGMHFFIPCTGYSNSEARKIAERMSKEIQLLAPDTSTVANAISTRGHLVYIDPSQNDYADTLAAAYSVRPNSIPTVSTPLEWKEVKAGLDPSVFMIKTVLKRFEKKGDLFDGLLDKKTAAANSKIISHWLE